MTDAAAAQRRFMEDLKFRCLPRLANPNSDGYGMDFLVLSFIFLEHRQGTKGTTLEGLGKDFCVWDPR